MHPWVSRCHPSHGLCAGTSHLPPPNHRLGAGAAPGFCWWTRRKCAVTSPPQNGIPPAVLGGKNDILGGLFFLTGKGVDRSRVFSHLLQPQAERNTVW